MIVFLVPFIPGYVLEKMSVFCSLFWCKLFKHCWLWALSALICWFLGELFRRPYENHPELHAQWLLRYLHRRGPQGHYIQYGSSDPRWLPARHHGSHGFCQNDAEEPGWHRRGGRLRAIWQSLNSLVKRNGHFWKKSIWCSPKLFEWSFEAWLDSLRKNGCSIFRMIRKSCIRTDQKNHGDTFVQTRHEMSKLIKSGLQCKKMCYVVETNTFIEHDRRRL